MWDNPAKTLLNLWEGIRRKILPQSWLEMQDLKARYGEGAVTGDVLASNPNLAVQGSFEFVDSRGKAREIIAYADLEKAKTDRTHKSTVMQQYETLKEKVRAEGGLIFGMSISADVSGYPSKGQVTQQPEDTLSQLHGITIHTRELKSLQR